MNNKPCPECGHEFDWMQHLTDVESGTGFNFEFGQAEHWFSGVVTCPKCQASWEYGDSSL